MPRDTAQPKLNPIILAAIAEGSEPYRFAIASEIENDSAGAMPHWQDFQRIIARAMVLAVLEGEARTTQRAKTLGAEFEFAPVPDETLRFAKVLDFDSAEPQVVDIDFGDTGDPLVTKPFAEAIRAFENRVPMLADQIRPMLNAARELAEQIAQAERGDAIAEMRRQSVAFDQALSRAFWASDVDQGTIVNLKELLADSLRGTADIEGLGLPEFISEAQLQGASGLTDARLETIYRVNINRAFTDGQSAVLRDEAVQAVIPLVELDEIRDNRSRPTHAAMSGYVNTQAEFDRQGINPPSGFNCRGSKREIPRGEAIRRGFMTKDGVIDGPAIDAHNGARQTLINTGQYPDPGWVSSAA